MISTRLVSASLLGLGSNRMLALAGEIPPWPRLAVVGSRAAHRTLRSAVPHAIATASEHGWSIVSGGAIGIDGDAHTAALTLHVPQLAVLPCGPDVLYPADNAALLRAIPSRPRSGLLFALEPGVALRRTVFASRNAIVVALCDGVLVIEAQTRSGSALTGDLALRRRKPLAVVLGSPGNTALASRGATALHFDPSAPEAFASGLAAFLRGDPVPTRRDAWPEELAWLRDAIIAGGELGATVDQLGPRAVLALARAEAAGLVAELTAGRWIVV